MYRAMSAPPPFQQFQRAFARYLRDPHHVAHPSGVDRGRARLYQRLLFNNLRGFLDRCFPVCRAVLGEARWTRLMRCFWRDWPLATPWFREIPREFVRYLAEGDIAMPRPRWLADLARHEWAELAVDVMDAPVPPHDPHGELFAGKVVLNPAMMNLAYDWPVHRIGPDFRPRKPQPTFIVVHRDVAGKVQFTEINAVTSRLLDLLAECENGRQAIERLAAEVQHPDADALQQFAAPLLGDLRQRGIVLGTSTATGR